MTVPPRKRPAAIARIRATAADPKVEEAVKKLMDRYPHLQPGVDDTADDEPDERFADAARELFKKRMRG